MSKISLIVMLLIFSSAAFRGCQSEGKKDCDWVLEPAPENAGKADEGYVPVCARNRTADRQDCQLQIKLELAKTTDGKKFRYSDIKFGEKNFPKIIESISFCDR